MSLYALQIRILQIYENIKYKRCKECDEIIFDSECDYCVSI